jgi:Domain of unknown function (DUF222)
MTATPFFAVSDASSCNRSVDDLDRAICQLVRQMNAECYSMLELVREFDERLGFAKWSFKTCAEWLAWRCGLSLSAAREKVRTAHALRALPDVAAAFKEGRLSYSKVRALTRVADPRNEDLLLAYALEASVAHSRSDAGKSATSRRSPSMVRDALGSVVRPRSGATRRAARCD